MSLKEIGKLVSIWQSWRQKYTGTFFPDMVYIYNLQLITSQADRSFCTAAFKLGIKLGIVSSLYGKHNY